VILQIDGENIVEENDLARVIAAHKPGDKVSLTVLHDNERQKVELTLGKRPDKPSSS
jgi:S1-C subfamily serine protease